MWPEVEKAKSENRHELVLSGNNIANRIKETGLDYTIFQLTALNYLSLSQLMLSNIPDEIENLVNLRTLVLHTNELETINEKIGSLEKLKMLDLSANNISNIPESLGNLSQLTTLTLNANCIEDCPSIFKKCTKLALIDLSNNQLQSFPDICSEELSNLAELKLAGNCIQEIPNTIHHLPALKLLDLGSNEVNELPGELSDCQKLKDLNLKENPISDRRLLKLIEQCRTKQILDYVKLHSEKTSAPKENNASKRKTANKSKTEHGDDGKVEYKYNMTVKIHLPNFQVIVTKEVKNVREHFIGCIVRNVTFTDESFKKFIQLQNKLHDTICEKRNVATIATHDFNKLPPGNLQYTTAPPKELSIIPLHRGGVSMTGLELFTKLQIEANNLRKEKKRNTYSGIHKYLYLIEGKPKYPCLMNSKDEVISLPPISNSEISKLEMTTKQIFIEVTSPTSLGSCRLVMDTLLKEMVLLLEQNVEIIQVKTTDPEGNLKNVYPSRIDLSYDKTTSIQVFRNL